MEKLYKKEVLPSGAVRYRETSYYSHGDLCDGLWMIQKHNFGRSQKSLLWKIGDIPEADMRTHAMLQKFDDRLSSFIMQLRDENSDSYKEVKEITGRTYGPLGIYNWSAGDVATVILRELAKYIQEENEKSKI